MIYYRSYADDETESDDSNDIEFDDSENEVDSNTKINDTDSVIYTNRSTGGGGDNTPTPKVQEELQYLYHYHDNVNSEPPFIEKILGRRLRLNDRDLKFESILYII